VFSPQGQTVDRGCPVPPGLDFDIYLPEWPTLFASANPRELSLRSNLTFHWLSHRVNFFFWNNQLRASLIDLNDEVYSNHIVHPYDEDRILILFRGRVPRYGLLHEDMLRIANQVFEPQGNPIHGGCPVPHKWIREREQWFPLSMSDGDMREYIPITLMPRLEFTLNRPEYTCKVSLKYVDGTHHSYHLLDITDVWYIATEYKEDDGQCLTDWIYDHAYHAWSSSCDEADFGPQSVFDILQLPDAIDGFADAVDGVNSTLNAKIPSLVDGILHFSRSVDSLGQSIKNFDVPPIQTQHTLDLGGSLASIFGKVPLKLKVIIVTLVGVIVLRRYGTVSYALIAGVLALAGIAVSEKVRVFCMGTIKLFCGEFEPQGALGSFDIKSAACLVWNYFSDGCDFSLNERVKTFTSFVTEGAHLKQRALLEDILFLFKRILQWLDQFVPVDPRILSFFDPFPAASVLAADVEILRKEVAGGCTDYSTVHARIATLKDKINHCMLKYRNDKSFVPTLGALKDAVYRLDTLSQEIILSGGGRDVTRVPPVALVFYGPPGVGKSFALDFAITAFLMHMHRDNPNLREVLRDKSTQVFSKNFASEYWEGYNNQPIVLLDEIGQSRVTPGGSKGDDEFFQVLEMVNDRPVVLNMAAVEKKGTVMFDSPLILGTTNSRIMKPDTLNEPRAYDRRLTMFEFHVKDRYAKLVSDKSGGYKTFDLALTRRVCAEDGMSEEETNRFIATSQFLTIRQRKSVLDLGYVGEEMCLPDLIRFMIERVDDRKVKVSEKMSTRDIHLDYLSQEFGIPLPSPKEKEKEECFCLSCQNLPRDSFWAVKWWYKKKCLENGFDLTDEQLERIAADDDHMPQSAEWSDSTFNYECFTQAFGSGNIFLATSNVFAVLYNHLTQMGKSERSRQSRCYACFYVWACLKPMIKGFLAGYAAVKAYHVLKGLISGPNSTSDSGNDDFSPELITRQRVPNEKQSSILRRNTVMFSTTLNGERKHIGYGLAVAGSIVCVPYHYVDNWRKHCRESESFEVFVQRIGEGPTGTVHPVYIRKVLERDIFRPDAQGDCAFIYLDDMVNYPFPDISLNIASPTGQVVGLLPDIDGELDLSDPFESVLLRRHPKPIGYYLEEGERIDTLEPITYQAKTVVGHCGLPVFVSSRTSHEKVLAGMHIAGSGTIGVAFPLCDGAITRAIKFYKERYPVIRMQMRQHVLHGPDPIDESPPPRTHVPGKMTLCEMPAPPIPTSTNIIRSPLYGNIGYPPTTVPAMLRPFAGVNGELIDPIGMSDSKYSRDSPLLDLTIHHSVIADIVDATVNLKGKIVDDRISKRVLTFEEAVAGVHCVEGFDGVPRKTSAGYPLTLELPGRGKQSLFGAEGNYDFSSDECKELRAEVESTIDEAKRCNRGVHVFMDFPKDERRPKEKALSGKTRKISACPIDMTIAIRMYFGAFVQFTVENRIFNESAIGVNMYSKEVDIIVDHMNSNDLGVPAKIIAGDFGNFDGSIPYSIMMAFLTVVTAYYGDAGSENETIRKVLFLDLANSLHIGSDGLVKEWVGSNASGNALTTPINNFINQYVLRTATCLVRPDKTISPFKFLKSLRGKVKYLVFGDDNKISVPDTCEYEFLSQASYTAALATIGFTYTDEDKGTTTREHRTIYDVSFLKRRYARNSTIVGRIHTAPLALSSILESIQWTKKHDEDYEFLKDNVCKMIMELSLHDRATFDKWVPLICQASIQYLDYSPPNTVYEVCQAEIQSSYS
jgi:hypothetical protein